MTKKNSLRILFVTPECAPWVKTGGLGDVSAALPRALRESGIDVRVLLPGYPDVLRHVQGAPVAAELALPGFPPARLLRARLPDDVPLWVVDCPECYERGGGPYGDEQGRDWPDNPLRFGLLSRAAALLCGAASPLDWRPAVVHCNDWQTGLVPAYLHFDPQATAASVMTLHNLAFQGIFPPEWVGRLGLPQEAFSMNGVEYYGRLSFLKAGLYYADRLTTVSPRYALEIQSAPLGFGLEGLLAGRREALTGIVNGIDTELWDSARDPHLAARYDAATLDAKAGNKRVLQQRLGLRVEPDMPLLGVVSRLTPQKGLDWVVQVAARIMALPAQLAVLGSGDAELEAAFGELARRYPGQAAVRIGFAEPLAHLLEAGADIFLMPSRFEPCGLNQMYSQRYGTPPVVHATGGLSDTVSDATADPVRGTGFVFPKTTAASFFGAVGRAVRAYRDPALWRRIQQNGMARDFGWPGPARSYAALYGELVRSRGGATLS